MLQQDYHTGLVATTRTSASLLLKEREGGRERERDREQERAKERERREHNRSHGAPTGTDPFMTGLESRETEGIPRLPRLGWGLRTPYLLSSELAVRTRFWCLLSGECPEILWIFSRFAGQRTPRS